MLFFGAFCAIIDRAMTNDELNKRAHDALGGKGWKRRLQDLTGRDYATVKRWAAGSLDVPQYVEVIIEMIESTPANVSLPARFQKLEIRGLARRTRAPKQRKPNNAGATG